MSQGAENGLTKKCAFGPQEIIVHTTCIVGELILQLHTHQVE